MVSPEELLVIAARRLSYCRRNGPAHEINWSLELIDVAIIGLGFGEDYRQDLPKMLPGLFPGEEPPEYAAKLWPKIEGVPA